jgi:hypothetical protein
MRQKVKDGRSFVRSGTLRNAPRLLYDGVEKASMGRWKAVPKALAVLTVDIIWSCSRT